MTAPLQTFRSTRRFVAPRWLIEGEGGLVGYALDLIKDASMKRLVLGLRARFPQDPIDPTGQTTAPADALIAMGRDRRVFRGIFETDAEYAARLVSWTDDAQARGSAFGLMKTLHAYTGTAHGVSFRTVDVRGNWFSRAANGSETYSLNTGNWNWDGDTSTTGDTSRWSRFWVIIYPSTLWTASSDQWASGGHWADPSLIWGFADMTPEQANNLRSIISDWKPAGTRCVNIIVAFDPASFNPTAPEPDGTWGKPYKIVGDDRVPSRLSTARYLAGK